MRRGRPRDNPGALGIRGTDKPWPNRQNVDWTWGCISIDNDSVRELASLVYVGTPVLRGLSPIIRPAAPGRGR